MHGSRISAIAFVKNDIKKSYIMRPGALILQILSFYVLMPCRLFFSCWNNVCLSPSCHAHSFPFSSSKCLKNVHGRALYAVKIIFLHKNIFFTTLCTLTFKRRIRIHWPISIHLFTDSKRFKNKLRLLTLLLLFCSDSYYSF